MGTSKLLNTWAELKSTTSVSKLYSNVFKNFKFYAKDLIEKISILKIHIGDIDSLLAKYWTDDAKLLVAHRKKQQKVSQKQFKVVKS